MLKNNLSYVQFHLQMLYAFSYYGKCNGIQDAIKSKNST